MQFQDKEECRIVRPPHSQEYGDLYKNRALLVTEDLVIFSFDTSWTDDQIWHALLFVNAKFHHGVEAGIESARLQMRLALGFDDTGCLT